MDLVLGFNRILRLCSSSLRLLQKNFSLSLLNCTFIVKFLCIYLRSHFIPFLLLDDFNFFSFWKFLTLVPFLVSFLWNLLFFSSFLATMQTEFFVSIMTRLEISVKHNLLGYIYNSYIYNSYITAATCDLRRNHLCPSVIRHQSALKIEHLHLTLYLHF